MLIAAIVGSLMGGPAARARADGDPASDVLATQALFLPWDAEVPPARQAQLQALLRAAESRHHPLRLALIASAGDLGSVSALWRKPQPYAQFLGEELSLVYRGPLLVVMPNGFGLANFDLPRRTVRSVLAGIPVSHTGVGLADDAMTALLRLSRAEGYPLMAPAPAAAVVHDTADILPWLVFVLGLLLIALAWAQSLRARGLRGA